MKSFKFFVAAMVCLGIASAPVMACDGAKKASNKEACSSKKVADKEGCCTSKKVADNKKPACCSKGSSAKMTENKTDEQQTKATAPNN